jgi:hypothetical protein
VTIVEPPTAVRTRTTVKAGTVAQLQKQDKKNLYNSLTHLRMDDDSNSDSNIRIFGPVFSKIIGRVVFASLPPREL